MSLQNATTLVETAGQHMAPNSIALWVVCSFIAGVAIGVFGCLAASLH